MYFYLENFLKSNVQVYYTTSRPSYNQDQATILLSSYIFIIICNYPRFNNFYKIHEHKSINKRMLKYVATTLQLKKTNLHLNIMLIILVLFHFSNYF